MDDKQISVNTAVDYGFKVIESILTSKNYNTKEELLTDVSAMVKVVESDPKYSNRLKESYKDAYNRLSAMDFEEIKETTEILKSYQQDDDDDDEEDY